MVFVTIIANSALLPLFYLWGGMTPSNKLKELYINEKLHFHPDTFIIYLCYIILYTFPLCLILFPSLLKNKKRSSIALLFSFIYWVFPVSTSKSALEAGFSYIGLFHKGVSFLITSNIVIGIIYQLLLFSALLFFIHSIELSIKSIKLKQNKKFIFPLLSLLSFLIIMPFSYLTWEKYILPAVPFAYILFFETPEIQKIIHKISLFCIKEQQPIS